MQYHDKKKLNEALLRSAKKGQLAQVAYWLTSPELALHASVHAHNDQAFQLACTHDLEVVKYLLTSPELTQHAHIHTFQDAALRGAFQNGHMHIVSYLLYDMRIQVLPSGIHGLLSKDNAKALLSMMEKRDLFFQINQALSHKEQAPSSKAKI